MPTSYRGLRSGTVGIRHRPLRLFRRQIQKQDPDSILKPEQHDVKILP